MPPCPLMRRSLAKNDRYHSTPILESSPRRATPRKLSQKLDTRLPQLSLDVPAVLQRRFPQEPGFTTSLVSRLIAVTTLNDDFAPESLAHTKFRANWTLPNTRCCQLQVNNCFYQPGKWLRRFLGMLHHHSMDQDPLPRRLH